MKKTVLTSFTILCLLSPVFLMGTKLSVKAGADIVYVPDDYERIQWAIGNVSSGDTIYVRGGTYYENVIVNKTVSLIGENRSNTIIDGNGTGTVVTITQDNINITGFTIQNPGSFPDRGIVLYSNENNITANNIHGISLEESSNNTISGNNISSLTNNVRGIELHRSDGNTIARNTITNNSAGIYMYSSGNNFLRDNSMAGNVHNFGVYGTLLSGFINDIDTSNTVDGKTVYYWVNEHDRQVPSDAGYVGIVNSTGIIVRNLTLTKNYQGVLFAHTKDSKIENVHTSYNNDGIFLVVSDNNAITGNIVTNNYVGIDLLFSDDTTITGSTLTDNWLDGILLGYSDGNILVGNNLVNGYRTGIRLWSSSYNTIRGNAITNSKGSGMSIKFGSYNNTIYDNNFINNTNQVTIDPEYPSKNTWDDGYPSGGNYWSDYSGTDLYSGTNQNETGYDWIWDSPYIIDENNKDNYPLTDSYVPERQETRVAYRNLLEKYNELLADFDALNTTCHALQDDYEVLNESCNDLKDRYISLNATFYQLLDNYDALVLSLDNLTMAYDNLSSNYSRLQESYYSLQTSYESLQGVYDALNMSYDSLSSDYNNLLANYQALNSTYSDLLSLYNTLKSKHEETISELYKYKNLIYTLTGITIAGIVILIAITVYFAIRKPKTKP